MKSVLFVVTRALATRNVQAALAALWIWIEKTVQGWDDALAAIAQKENALSAALVAMRSQAQVLDGSLEEVTRISRDVVRLGKSRFRNEAEKAALYHSVRLEFDGRPLTQKTGRSVYEVWAKTDAAWVPLPDLTLSVLGSLLAAAEAQEAVLSQKRTAWRAAGIAVMTAAAALDRDNVAWYNDATVRFPADTEQGQLIRSMVPTTTTAQPAVGQAVIENLMVAGRELHFDVSAAHATSYTYYQLAPGASEWVAVLSNVPQTSLTLHDQPVGEHRFKAVGHSSRGSGAASAEAVVTVAEAAVA